MVVSMANKKDTYDESEARHPTFLIDWVSKLRLNRRMAPAFNRKGSSSPVLHLQLSQS
jgi:hypothetical protein